MRLRIIFPVILSAILIILCKAARVAEDPSARVDVLLEEASKSLSRQEYDVAMEKALKALEMSAGTPSMKVRPSGEL